MQAKTQQLKPDIRSLMPEEIEAVLTELGEPKFRAKQIFAWLSRSISSFNDMTNLPQSLRTVLSEKYSLCAPKQIRKQVSQLDGTVKYLWELEDGNAVETVVMSYKHGNTVCISSQVGCRMGCAFCASTIDGLVRNLEPSEMLAQVLFSEMDFGKPISNIVLMGIGEPLDNFDNVIRFLELINHPEGRGIGMRHISLSTCGITEKFDKLGDYNLQLTLSVSLHAPDDETRSKLMPVNKVGGVDKLMKACEEYFKKTGRRISFEYAMIKDVNDTLRHAGLLANRMKKLSAHVNLIPLNHVDERSLEPSEPEQIKAFAKALEDKGVNVTVRRRLGSDVDASCGQLRRKAASK